ncbi:MAG: thiosulfate oxidation carrier complex protein SoxZ [Gammaproteobacteria bacterium]|nr:thiosulfate oxidation carrier complex protein SoxZ [Gammaproteobacteria bacterium]
MHIATRMKTRTQGGITEVLILVNHPMDTGLVKSPLTHKIIPAHFIKTLTVAINHEPAVITDMGIAVSKDPLIAVKLKGAKSGDLVSVDWIDNEGMTGHAETHVS